MIDPWRNLPDWNKPANKDNSTFDLYYHETLDNTDFAKEKRIILRGKTVDIIYNIPDESIDLIYIDGDHTLRGITIDLLKSWGKIRKTGFIGGDDFSPTIWQHKKEFEPTFVFPYAVFFAEGVGAEISALPFNQFLIEKNTRHFHFHDMTNGQYMDTGILSQLKKI